MNNRFTSNTHDALGAFQKLMKQQRTVLSGLIAVKGGRAVINVALSLLRLLQAKAPTKSNVRICKDFAFKVYKLAKHNNVDFVVKYLKTCSIMLQQSVAKHTVKTNSREIGGVAVSATRRGLPRIIPKAQRVLIRRGNTKAITFWLSLFNLYRYLECAYKSKDHFATITQPNDWVPSSDVSDFVPIFWARLKKVIGGIPSSDLKVKVPQIMQSVSVNVTERLGLKGSSIFAAMNSLHNIRFIANVVMAAHVNVNAFKESGLTKDEFVGFQKLILAYCHLAASWWPSLLSLFMGPLNRPESIAQFKDGVMPWPKIPGAELINKRAWLQNYTRPNAQLAEIWNNVIGKLSLLLFGKKELFVPAFGRLVKLYEAAGKVRVIAIVDPFTNWLLKPLHDWLFSILRNIPQDGTFDQDAPLKALTPLEANTFVGSCDMSAATDRLPVKLQALILSHIFGPRTANAWMNLLISRPYKADKKSLWYAVGQPMGALSSWAMLAITHHFLWQWAAYRCNYTGGWFKSYAVLGDDSVSLVKPIVQEYLKICAELGVKVNLAKSLLSPVGAFEFAKRFITRFGNCSPISIGEILVAHKNFATMANFPRKRKIRFSDLLSIMGYRHKVTGSMEKRLHLLPKRARNMMIVSRSPWGAYPTKSLLEWLRLDGFNRFKNRDLSNLGVNILVCIDKLRHKAIQIVDSNNLNYKMSGIGGDKPSETMTQEMRDIDPQSFRALLDLVLEPARKEVFFKAVAVLIAVKDLQVEMQKRIFFLSESDLEYYWEQYLKFEKELYSIFGGDVYQQKVEKPFVEPSPRQVVSLWNRLQRDPQYRSKADLPDMAILRTVEKSEFDKNKVKLWHALVDLAKIPKDKIFQVLLTKSSRYYLGPDSFITKGSPIVTWADANDAQRSEYIHYCWLLALDGKALVQGKLINFPPVNLPFGRFMFQFYDRFRIAPNWIVAVSVGFDEWQRKRPRLVTPYSNFEVVKAFATKWYEAWCKENPPVVNKPVEEKPSRFYEEIFYVPSKTPGKKKKITLYLPIGISDSDLQDYKLYVAKYLDDAEGFKTWFRKFRKVPYPYGPKKTIKETVHEIHEFRNGKEIVHSFPIPSWCTDSDKHEYIKYVKDVGIYAWQFQKWYDFRYKYSDEKPRKDGKS